jgi:DNA replication regulator SLD2
MDHNVRAEYESQASRIRADLKKWESEWAATHEGAKPGRDDIKRNAEMGMTQTPSDQCSPICRTKIEDADYSSSTQIQGL